MGTGTIALPLPKKTAKTTEKHKNANEIIVKITSIIFIHFFKVLLLTSNRINETQKIKLKIIKPTYDVRRAKVAPAAVLRT
jgi:hypothetical protein